MFTNTLASVFPRNLMQKHSTMLVAYIPETSNRQWIANLARKDAFLIPMCSFLVKEKSKTCNVVLI